jgi:hypothetical protein
LQEFQAASIQAFAHAAILLAHNACNFGSKRPVHFVLMDSEAVVSICCIYPAHVPACGYSVVQMLEVYTSLQAVVKLGSKTCAGDSGNVAVADLCS